MSYKPKKLQSKKWFGKSSLQNYPKWFLVIGLVFAFSVYSYICVASSYQPWLKDVVEGSKRTCEELQLTKTRLLILFQRCLDTFKRHDFPVFLMYGSIWGALRGYKGPLPWDYDIDVGIEWTEYSEKKVAAIAEDLKPFNISVDYGVTQAGLIKFKDQFTNKIDLFIFKAGLFYRAWRPGWEPRLLVIHYLYYHTFPYQLIANSRTLEQVGFGSGTVRIPRGGIEIMKYLYRDNWKVKKIPKGYNC